MFNPGAEPWLSARGASPGACGVFLKEGLRPPPLGNPCPGCRSLWPCLSRLQRETAHFFWALSLPRVLTREVGGAGGRRSRPQRLGQRCTRRRGPRAGDPHVPCAPSPPAPTLGSFLWSPATWAACLEAPAMDHPFANVLLCRTWGWGKAQSLPVVAVGSGEPGVGVWLEGEPGTPLKLAVSPRAPRTPGASASARRTGTSAGTSTTRMSRRRTGKAAAPAASVMRRVGGAEGVRGGLRASLYSGLLRTWAPRPARPVPQGAEHRRWDPVMRVRTFVGAGFCPALLRSKSHGALCKFEMRGDDVIHVCRAG